jgi:Flp pilus assembly protein TadD
LSQNAQQHQEDMAAKQQDNQLKLQETQLREQSENQRQMADLTVRERMNTADNTTAMQLAQAEIMSGEKIAVSTGTGINPGTR